MSGKALPNKSRMFAFYPELHMIRRSLLGLLLFCAVSVPVSGQVGGSSVYSFLQVSSSARVAALGGTNISISDNDPNLAMQSPSLLNPSMQRQLAFSAVNYFADVKFGDVAYAFGIRDYGTFLAAIHYAGYGEFDETDVTGAQTGTFRASDMALELGYGKALNPRISVGAMLKTIYSDYYLYKSFGLAADIAATYNDTANRLTVTVAGKNIGAQLKGYTSGNNEPLPVEVQAGVSKRLEHVPFRVSLTARHLEKFDMTYVDPNDPDNIDPITGEQVIQNISFGEKLARHFIIGGEFLFSQNFHVRLAYNFQRRKEMLVDTHKGTVGFSWGFGLRVSKFHISYGRAAYHLAGPSNHFSITANLGEFYSKKHSQED
jgi:hypothetical protein